MQLNEQTHIRRERAYIPEIHNPKNHKHDISVPESGGILHKIRQTRIEHTKEKKKRRDDDNDSCIC